MKNRFLRRIPLFVLLVVAVALCSVNVSAGNDGLMGANIKDGQLLGYYGDGGDITIPNTVTIIAGEAFLDNDNVTSVTIPGSVQVIGYHAFDGCTAQTASIIDIAPTIAKIMGIEPARGWDGKAIPGVG